MVHEAQSKANEGPLLSPSILSQYSSPVRVGSIPGDLRWHQAGPRTCELHKECVLCAWLAHMLYESNYMDTEREQVSKTKKRPNNHYCKDKNSRRRARDVSLTGLRPRPLRDFSMLMWVLVCFASLACMQLVESFPNMDKALRSSPSQDMHWWGGAHLESQQVGGRGRRFRNSKPPQLHRAV